MKCRDEKQQVELPERFGWEGGVPGAAGIALLLGGTP